MAKKIVVYTANPCPFCSRAKALLQQRGIHFQEIQLSYDDEDAWDELSKKSGMKTVPQIFSDDSLIGGYSELSALDRKDQLVSLK
jgi:glutaredoxin 3